MGMFSFLSRKHDDDHPVVDEKPRITSPASSTIDAPLHDPSPSNQTHTDSIPKQEQEHYDSHDPHPFVPPLPFNIHLNNRIRKIVLTFALCFFEAGLLPLILFYALKWGAHLSITINLAIITSVIGTFSGYRFSIRLWWLWFSKEGHERRVIGSGRWGVDTFQIIASVGMGAFFIPLIIGSSVNPASPHITSLALPLLILTFAIPLLLTSLLPHTIRVPFRVSSIPPLQPLPPFAFTLVEDIVAVDGGGGTSFRRAWAERYQASATMRKLIRDVSFVWGLTGTVFGAVWTGIVVSDFVADDVAIGIGYGLPWAWAIVMAAWTAWYSRRMIAKEYRDWEPIPSTDSRRPGVHRDMSLHVVERVIGSGPSARPPLGLPQHISEEHQTTAAMLGGSTTNPPVMRTKSEPNAEVKRIWSSNLKGGKGRSETIHANARDASSHENSLMSESAGVSGGMGRSRSEGVMPDKGLAKTTSPLSLIPGEGEADSAVRLLTPPSRPGAGRRRTSSQRKEKKSTSGHARLVSDDET